MSEWQTGRLDAITDVPGIRVGHWTDKRAATGCTVILCETATAAAVDARGGAPGSRETDVLDGANLVRTCQAIVLTGGSAYGLAAADGVMRWLSEKGIGFKTAARPVPIVPAAVLYDLGVGKAEAPTPESGYLAASRAKGGKVAEGSVGAGTGATVAKLLGPERSLKGGLGTASVVGPRGIVVGAIVATNAVGNIMDAATGEPIAAVRADEPGHFFGLEETLLMRTAQLEAVMQNTTLVCVATNANLDHARMQRIAYQAHDGMARAIVPAHTTADGDIAFAVTTGQVEVKPFDALTVGVMASVAVERAIARSVRTATGLCGVPAISEWNVAQH